eukprot:scaffold312853_cov23-Tisochrysis_lutea.AAC.2
MKLCVLGQRLTIICLSTSQASDCYNTKQELRSSYLAECLFWLLVTVSALRTFCKHCLMVLWPSPFHQLNDHHLKHAALGGGLRPLHRMASNDLAIGAEALLKAGGFHVYCVDKCTVPKITYCLNKVNSQNDPGQRSRFQ